MSTLREILDAANTAPVTLDRRSDEWRVINQAEVDLRVATHQVAILRSALARYAPESFYADVAPTSSAGQDRGAHARWVLQLTDPSPV